MFRVIRWTVQRPLQLQGAHHDTIVWVDAIKLDAAWKRDKADHIGPCVSGPGNGSRHKYQRFGCWVLNNRRKVRMPYVSYRRGAVSFTDGRHRFAWMRDRGERALPVIASCREAPTIARLFGTR